MKTPWWKYVMAVLAFLVLFFLAPVLVNIVWNLTNLFTPKYYQSSAEWINIASTAFGVGIALFAADAVLDSVHPKFSMVLSIICAFYMVAVGVWNFALAVTTAFNMIAMFAGAAVAIVFAVKFGKRVLQGSTTDETQENIPSNL